MNEWILARLNDTRHAHHCRPQVDYLRNARGERVVDVVVHFEHMQRDFAQLFDAFGVSVDFDDVAINSARWDHKLTVDDVDVDTEQRVREYYQDDFIEFNYS